MLAFCKCRESPETESFFCGLLRAGQRTRVEQTRRLPSGLLRVRTRLGWASVVSTSGEPLLKMLGIVQHTDEDEVGLYPIVTLQYSSTTLYQVSYHIRWLLF